MVTIGAGLLFIIGIFIGFVAGVAIGMGYMVSVAVGSRKEKEKDNEA